jgi:hypothetical protein
MVHEGITALAEHPLPVAAIPGGWLDLTQEG